MGRASRHHSVWLCLGVESSLPLLVLLLIRPQDALSPIFSTHYLKIGTFPLNFVANGMEGRGGLSSARVQDNGEDKLPSWCAVVMGVGVVVMGALRVSSNESKP